MSTTPVRHGPSQEALAKLARVLRAQGGSLDE